MAVLLDTSLGELVIDLYVKECPTTTKNFLNLCKLKYYNGNLFWNVQSNYIAQTGDPTGTGAGGVSSYGLLEGSNRTCFDDEISRTRKHNKVGVVAMSSTGPNTSKSQFYITLRGDNLDHLDGKHTIFGEIAEGMDILDKLNDLYCDDEGRPYQDIRIRHSYILDNPFDTRESENGGAAGGVQVSSKFCYTAEEYDALAAKVPPASPTPNDSPTFQSSTGSSVVTVATYIPPQETVAARIPYEQPMVTDEAELARTDAALEASIKAKEAKSRAIVLEMTGDIPDADIKPPDEVLFICKLNAVTRDEDLELIFCRFGNIKSCEVIRDPVTNASLNYAFIEYELESSCLEAYEKMNNVLIDDRRIKVDFSQSVSKLWNRYIQAPRKPAVGGAPNKAAVGPTKGGGDSARPPRDRPRDNGGPRRDISGMAPRTGYPSTDRDRDRDAGHSRDYDRDRDRDAGHSRDRKTGRSRNRDCDAGRSRDHDRDHDRDAGRSRDYDRDRERDAGRSRDRDHDRDAGRSRDYDRDRDRDAGRSRDRDRDHDRDAGRSRDYDRDHDHDAGRSRDRDAGRSRDYDRDRECDLRRLDRSSQLQRRQPDGSRDRGSDRDRDKRRRSRSNSSDGSDRRRRKRKQTHGGTSRDRDRHTHVNPSFVDPFDSTGTHTVTIADYKHKRD